MPKRSYPRALIFEQLCGELLSDPLRRQEKPMGRHHDEDGNQIADQADVHPIKRPGEPMRYRRDVARHDLNGIAAESAHVRAHLASIADYDDDPDTRADDVTVRVLDHVDGDPGLVSIVGELDAEPDAPYLRPGYDPAADDDGTRFTRYSEEGQE